ALELPRRVGGATAPEEGPAEMELRGRAARVGGDEVLERLEAVIRPAGEGDPDLRLDRVVAAEDPLRRGRAARAEEPRALRKRARLGVGPHAEVERQRRPSRPRLGHRARRAAALTPALE